MSDTTTSIATPITAARFGRIPTAEARSGLKRGALYELARKHRGLFLKAGAATIVDLEFLDKILAELPPADIGAVGEAEAAAAREQSDQT